MLITKKHRTKRTKKGSSTDGNRMDSQTGPIPQEPAGVVQVSTVVGPDDTISNPPELKMHAGDGSHIPAQEDHIECGNETSNVAEQDERMENQADKESQDGNDPLTAQGEHEKSIPEDEDRGDDIYDQWHRFCTSYRLDKISSMDFVDKFSKAEDTLLPWAERDKVNELLQRRDLICYKIVEVLHQLPVGQNLFYGFVDKFSKAENTLLPWAERDKVNELLQRRDLICYKIVESLNWAQARKSINLFQTQADLPVTSPKRSADRVGSSTLTTCLRLEDFKAQLAKPTPEMQQDREHEPQIPESIADEHIEVVDRMVDTPASHNADVKIKEVEKVIASLDSRMMSMDSRMLSMDSNLQSMDSRLGSLDSKPAELVNHLKERGDAKRGEGGQSGRSGEGPSRQGEGPSSTRVQNKDMSRILQRRLDMIKPRTRSRKAAQHSEIRSGEQPS
ncbi:hypothetical protein F511_37877 [Dorcoceras hygrometricum]|uniref:Uncharacterized protein n=1 Tax=Dorcoceras hygrometricum TaxID=472368 RepID=A0A2Z7AWZ5_9LAMI|nr:hypothetical protein F511_37877 [Dorcoceras hygrometricum]